METRSGSEKSLPRAALRYAEDQLEADRILGGPLVVHLLGAHRGVALDDFDVELRHREPG